MRREKGTGTVVFRDGAWKAFAPKSKDGSGKPLRVATESTRAGAERALDAWLNRTGKIVFRDVKPAKICRRKTP
jgi:hypothetical protein